MGLTISSEEFKKLVTGSPASRLFTNRDYTWVRHIKTEEIGNTIAISGDFVVNEELIFKKGEVYDKEIIFDGGIYKNIIFRGGSLKKLFFRRGTFNGYVSIRGGTIGSIVLLGGQFNHWLGTLNGLGIKDNENDTKELADEALKISRFEIEGGTYVNNIWLSGGEIDRLELKCVTGVKIHCKPNDDQIFDENKKAYKCKFESRPKIKDLLIARYSNKDSFYQFSELTLDSINFENYTNLGNITIADVALNNTISIANSDLGKTTFIDCKFSKQKMIFDSSKITDIALAGAELPHPDNINSNDPDVEERKRQKRLAFSQIKKVYQTMGDAVTASQYQARELEIFRTITDVRTERFNLWLNKATSEYGQDWWKAFKVLMFWSTLFYIIFCFTLGIGIEFSEEGFYAFWGNFSHLPEFINPIRKSDFLPKVLIGAEETQVPKLAYFADSLFRIINAYFIYQLIAAFRKHGKKSD